MATQSFASAEFKPYLSEYLPKFFTRTSNFFKGEEEKNGLEKELFLQQKRKDINKLKCSLSWKKIELRISPSDEILFLDLLLYIKITCVWSK